MIEKSSNDGISFSRDVKIWNIGDNRIKYIYLMRIIWSNILILFIIYVSLLFSNKIKRISINLNTKIPRIVTRSKEKKKFHRDIFEATSAYETKNTKGSKFNSTNKILKYFRDFLHLPRPLSIPDEYFFRR